MDKPFYRRTEFWLTTIAAIPGLAIGLAEVFLLATNDGGLDPSNPLHALFIKISAVLVVVYTFSRQLNKAISSFLAKDGPLDQQ